MLRVPLLTLLFACTPLEAEELSATDGTTSASASTTTTSGADVGDSTTTTGVLSTSGSTEGTSQGSTSDDEEVGSDTDDTTTSTTSGGSDSVCGDGVIGGDEECDNGTENSDDAACTSLCKLGFCGDGLILVGKESCDDEDKNGDGSYGGCTDLCQLGPHCGDKIHQPDDEQCDALDPELEDGSRCIACVWEANLIFVSSTHSRGDLGGVEGADSRCQELALAAKLPNPSSFMAWISDGSESPQSRFSPPLGPFVLTNGAAVADSWDDLVNGGGLGNAINVNEYKAKIEPNRVWSNTTPQGLSIGGPDCDGWTNDSLGPKGGYGKSKSVDAAWTDAGAEWCSQTYQIYCVATAG